MAVTATVVERTPHRLVYLVSQDGQTGTTLTIANATLVTDALKGTPLGNLVAMPAATQAIARALIMGDGAPGGPGGFFTEPRAHCVIMARTTAGAWAVDADSSANAIVLSVTAEAAAADAYLHIIYAHSIDT